jgi:hypothetical protein
MNERIGTLFVDEIPMPVTRVDFREGQIWLYASAPIRDMKPGMKPGPREVRFHAPDGSCILIEVVDFPRVKLSSARSFTIELPFSLDSAVPGGPRPRTSAHLV